MRHAKGERRRTADGVRGFYSQSTGLQPAGLALGFGGFAQLIPSPAILLPCAAALRHWSRLVVHRTTTVGTRMHPVVKGKSEAVNPEFLICLFAVNPVVGKEMP